MKKNFVELMDTAKEYNGLDKQSEELVKKEEDVKMLKDLYTAYENYQDAFYEDDYTKMKLQSKFVDVFAKYSKEELKEEISNLESYIDFLKKQTFYAHDYKEIVKDKDLAFNPLEIYKLYLENDLAIYSVLAGCTDEYLKDVINTWIAYEYDTEAIMLVTNYMKQKNEILKK